MPSPELIEWISKLGFTGLLVLYAWDQRQQRIAAEARADKERALNEILTRETVSSSLKTEAALQSMLTIFTGRKADT